MTQEEEEELYNYFSTLDAEEKEKVKDFEDAMSYLDSKCVPLGATLTARIIMYGDMIRSSN